MSSNQLQFARYGGVVVDDISVPALLSEELALPVGDFFCKILVVKGVAEEALANEQATDVQNRTG